MGISGNLKTMVLAELLQWLSQGQKTGTLVFEGDEVEKKVYFDDGKIISSASTDHTEYLGSFIVAYGYATDEQVDEAIARQKEEQKLIGKILVDMGAIDEESLQQTLQLKAEESIYDIFTWDEGAFEFHDGELPSETMVRMEMDVQWVVLEGTRRLDEWNRMREIIPSEHCVPVAMTDLEAIEGIEETAARILGWVDDERSIAEISQGAHTGKFMVMQALVDQVQAGTVKVVKPKIIEVRVEVPAKGGDPGPPPQYPAYPQGYPYYGPPPGATPHPGSWPMAEAMPLTAEPPGRPAGPSTVSVAGQQLRFATSQGPARDAAPQPAARSSAASEEPASDPDGLLRQAKACRVEGSFEAALDRLKKAREKGAPAAKVDQEQEALQKALESAGIKLGSVPKLECEVDELMNLKISPQEGFMLTRVDGSYDIKSILKMSSGIARVDAQVLFWKLRESGHVSV